MSHHKLGSSLVAVKEDHSSRVLVIGAEWELGRAVVMELIKVKAQVTVLVDQMTDSAELNRQLEGMPQVKVLTRDVYQPFEVEAGFDYVFWLQQLHWVQVGKKVRVERILGATVGMSHVLNKALKWRAKVVLATTLYDLRDDKGLQTTDLTRIAEEMLCQYSREYGLRAGVVRVARLSLTQVLARDKQVQNWEKVLNQGGKLWLYPSVNEKYLFTKIRTAVVEMMRVAYTPERFQDVVVVDRAASRVEVSNVVAELAGVELSYNTEKVVAADGRVIDGNRGVKQLVAKAGANSDKLIQFMREWLAESPKKLEVGRSLEELRPAKKRVVSKFKTKSKLSWRWSSLKKPRFKKSWLAAVLAVIILISLPMVLVGTLLYQGGRDIHRLNEAVESGNMHELSRSARSAKQRFRLAQKVVQKIYPVAQVLGMGNSVEQTSELLAMLSRLTGGAEALVAGYEPAEALVGVVLKGDDRPVEEEIHRLKLALGAAEEELAFAQGILTAQRGRLADIQVFGLGKSFSVMAEKVPRLRKSLEQTETIVPLLPELLAERSKKTYLVLLQNNMELRPTGGFVGSFGLMTFDMGKLVDFKVEDVYTADGQLRGHVEPPKELKDNLGEAGWYLRDANWDPDFPTSAKRMEWFLQKELGREVDGVIAINLYTLQKLLKGLGPVTLHDYNETITAENLFERAEYYAEVNFFPGSAQKRNFLSALTKQMLVELEDAPPKQLVGVVQGLVESLNEKQTMVYMHDKTLQNEVERLGWSGKLGRASCESEASNCYADRLGIFEANVGVNKANYFVDREVSYELSLAKDLDTAEGVVTIDYRNRAQSESWPGGKYKNYLRLVLPAKTVFKQAMIGRVIVPDEAVTIHELPDKTVVGFLVEVPVLSQTRVQVKYELPLNLDPQTMIVNYRWWWQKQSGVGTDPLKVTVHYPAYLSLVRVYPDGNFSSQKAEFNITTRTDEVVRLDFGVSK